MPSDQSNTRTKAIKSLLISGFDYPPQTGGISRFMGAVTSALGPEQICCLTAARLQEQPSGPDVEAGGARIYRRPGAFTGRQYAQAINFGAAILEVMVRERPRVVQVASAHEGYIGLWLQRWFGLPFVVYAHGNEVLGAVNSSWPKPLLSLTRAAAVLAVSQFTARLVRNAGVDEERIEVLHPGCDVHRFYPHEPGIDVRRALLGERCNDRVILSVGRIVARKGHDMVVRALPRLLKRNPNVTYLVVGDGPNRNEIEELALRVGVRGSVRFAGKVSDDLLPDVYAMSDVFIMASREQPNSCDVEGFGLVFLEAGASSKPVVAGRSGGTADAVLDGITGIMVDPLDPDDIANALSQVLASPETAGRLGREGRARVVREFTWSHFARRLREILKEVVGSRSGRSN